VEHIEQAYEMLGLSTNANKREVEKRYLMIFRRLRARELRGTLTLMDEVELKSVNQAYRLILNEEARKLSEEYRVKHYGKYKRYSNAAEKLDHFFYYYKFHVFGISFTLMLIIFGIFSFTHIQREMTALANAPVADLSLLISSRAMPLQNKNSSHLLEQKLQRLLPDLKHIKAQFVQIPRKQNMDENSTNAKTRSLMLLTENPDLYIVDRDQFIKLLRLGYLRKLDKWDTYGVNLSNGTLPTILQTYEIPLIAAVSVTSKQPENALLFIQSFLVEQPEGAMISNES
jgi:hypothetical protein